MAVECCPISFSRATAPVDYHIEGALIARGQDVWIADTEIDSLASGECIRLVGVRMTNPSSGQDYLRVCNCSDLCWLKAERTTDPDTGLSKFIAQVPRTCCQCRLEIMVEPCCGPALETVPEDCFGTIRYDTCNPPTFDGDNVGLCYPRGREVPLQFNSWIRCNNKVLYFDRAELFYCRIDAPDEIVRTPTVVVTMPPSTTCPDACVVKVVAYYVPVCCECAVVIETEPCCGPVLTVPEDCFGVTSYDTCDPPRFSGRTGLCYSRETEGAVTFPETIVCNGHTYYYEHADVIICAAESYPVYTRTVTFTTPSEEDCPGDDCRITIIAHYTCCECAVILETEPCCGPVLTVPEDCFGTTSYDTCSPPDLCYRRGTHFVTEFPESITCQGHLLYFDHVTITLCGAPPYDVGARFVALTIPGRQDCPSDDCRITIVAHYVPCECEVTLKAHPCMNGLVDVTSDCHGVDQVDLSAPVTLTYRRGTSVSIEYPETITCDNVVYTFSFIVVQACANVSDEIRDRSIIVLMPDADDCYPCRVTVTGYYGVQCHDGDCGDLQAAISEVSYQISEIEWRIPCRECGGECGGCYTLICQLADSFYQGFVAILLRATGTECQWLRGYDFDLGTCVVVNECVANVIADLSVLFQISYWRWDCETGATRIAGRLRIDGCSIGLGWNMPSCMTICSQSCGGPSVFDHGFCGATATDRVLIGYYASLTDAIIATMDWLNNHDWGFERISGIFRVQ